TESMIESSAEVYIGQEKAVKNTEATFKTIVDDMDMISVQMYEVTKLFAGLDSIQTEAIDAVTSIASIAEESAAAVEEVLATEQEQSVSAELLLDMSESLSDIIQQLNENIERFEKD
ncbi:MAG: hypothetical protein PF505_02135, partial [Vallitaleaceae bacterium]|nr:hypothetical protein [Vallitaleaceae bacterium]